MASKVSIVKEVSFKEYSAHINDIESQYFKQLFIEDNNIDTPEETMDFINEHLEDIHNTNVHKYYKLMGLLSSTEIEKEEESCSRLVISN